MKHPRLLKALAATAACVCVALAGGCSATSGGAAGGPQATATPGADRPKFANQLAAGDARAPGSAAAAPAGDAGRLRVV